MTKRSVICSKRRTNIKKNHLSDMHAGNLKPKNPTNSHIHTDTHTKGMFNDSPCVINMDFDIIRNMAKHFLAKLIKLNVTQTKTEKYCMHYHECLVIRKFTDKN